MAFPYSEGSDYAESLLSAKLLFMESVFSWYAVYTAARAEKKVKERLDQIGIENYLPLRTEYRVWSDRKKKVSVPLISGYIFVHIGEFYQFNLSSCIRQQNSLTAQFVSFSLSNLANIFYPPQFLQ